MTQPDQDPARHPSDDLLLDLAQGLSAPATRRTLLEHLARCPACESRFQELAASHARAQAAAARLLAAGALPGPGAAIVRLRDARSRRRVPWMAAAAAVVLMLGANLFLRGTSRDGRPLGPDPRLPEARLRGAVRELGPGAGDSLLAEGLEAYNRGDWAAARRSLAAARVAGRLEDVRRIYLGSALLALDDPSGARTALEGLDPAVVPEPWKSEARWSLAMAYERTGRARAADSILAVLARDVGPVADRARAHRRGGPRVD